MADNKIEVEVTQQADHTPMDFFALCVSVLLTYYILDPTALDRHKELVQSAWGSLQHQISIWRTRRAIQTLPEIPEQ